MGRKPTKAATNMFCIARYAAAETDSSFKSREGASEKLHIDRTRLADIELGNISPYPDEVKRMSKEYNSPELSNFYCSSCCSLGKGSVKKVQMDDFDRLSLKVLGSLKDIDALRMSLIDISEDGTINEHEQKDFNRILDSLEKIAANANALKLWAQKNIPGELS